MTQLKLTSLDLRNLIKDFKVLEQGRIQKIYQNRHQFSFKIHSLQGDYFLNIVFPGLVFMSETVKYSTQVPGGLCMGLRKHLSNAKIDKIEQHKSERILKIHIKDFVIIIELFNKGNLILVKDDKILALYSHREQAGRQLKNRETFEYLEETSDNLNFKKPDFKKVISNSKKESIVLSLATEIGLGGNYSEEILHMANIDKATPPSEEIADKIYTHFQILLKSKPKPCVIDRENPLISSYDLSIFDKKIFFETISLAIEYLLEKEKPSQENPQVEKLNKILEMQEKSMKKMKEEILLNKQKGEKIYENYAFIKEIYNIIEKHKPKMEWSELLDTLKKHNKIASVDKKNLKIIVEL